MHLPAGHSIIPISVDYLGPHPVTPQGNTHVLLFNDHSSHRADMSTGTVAEITAEDTANVLIKRYILPWRWPRSIFSDYGLRVCPMLSHAVYEVTGDPPAPTIRTATAAWRA